jgi:threonine dehydratase
MPHPEPDALNVLWRYAARVVRVSEAEVAQAMRLLFTATHNVAEGAGAAPLAAALQERERRAGA